MQMKQGLRTHSLLAGDTPNHYNFGVTILTEEQEAFLICESPIYFLNETGMVGIAQGS